MLCGTLLNSSISVGKINIFQQLNLLQFKAQKVVYIVRFKSVEIKIIRGKMKDLAFERILSS